MRVSVELRGKWGEGGVETRHTGPTQKEIETGK